MTKYNEGDLVEAVKGDRRVIDRVVVPPVNPIHRDAPYLGTPSIFDPSSIASYKRAGYKLTTIERTAPPLPTEPGIYFPRRTFNPDVRIVRLSGGLWRDSEGRPLDEASMKWLRGIHRADPLTRFEPIPVTAKRVLDRVRTLFGAGATMLREVDEIAAEFGVTE